MDLRLKMRKKRVICIISTVALAACCMLSSCQKFPGGNMFDKDALSYLDMEWLEKPEGILKEEDNSKTNTMYRQYVYTASLESESYYFDYVKNIFSKILSHYKYVAYKVESVEIKYGLLDVRKFNYVFTSENLSDYVTEQGTKSGFYYFDFSAFVSNETYYSEKDGYIKLKNDTAISVGLYIPLTDEAYAVRKEPYLTVKAELNKDTEIFIWDTK